METPIMGYMCRGYMGIMGHTGFRVYIGFLECLKSSSRV